MAEDEIKEDVTEEDDVAKKGGLPTIVIIVIIAVVMGIGGFFVGKIFSGGDKEKTPIVEKEKKKEEQKKEGVKKVDVKKEDDTSAGDQEKGAKGEVEEGESEVEESIIAEEEESKPKKKGGLLILQPFTVNLNDPFGRRYAEVVLNLEIDDKEFLPTIKDNELIMPRIRDEIFMIISAKSYSELRGISGKVTLKEEIQMRVNEIMKEVFNREPVSHVWITKFIMQ